MLQSCLFETRHHESGVDLSRKQRSSYHSDLSITRWSHWMVLQILKEGIDFVFLTVFSYVMLKLHFFVLILKYMRDSIRC